MASSLFFSNYSSTYTLSYQSLAPNLHARPPSELIDFRAFFAALGSSQNEIPPTALTWNQSLGRGANYNVSREVYRKAGGEARGDFPFYVAVKRIRSQKQAEAKQTSALYDGVVRELRVLTHPGLGDSKSVMGLLAFGWEDAASPYLVMEYSPHGTLTEYLTRAGIIVYRAELRDLALDVAMGVRALHRCKIIHGDIKPTNVLVVDNDTRRSPQMAKIADFGASIFERDGLKAGSYTGTLLYNAPEVILERTSVKGERDNLKSFYKADIYAFGLTLWEVMKKGQCYIEDEWLPREQLASAGLKEDARVNFVLEAARAERNEMLERGLSFFKGYFEGWKREDIFQPVLETLKLTLLKSWEDRADIEQVVKALSQGFPYQEPAASFPTIRYTIPSSELSEEGRATVKEQLVVDLGPLWKKAQERLSLEEATEGVSAASEQIKMKAKPISEPKPRGRTRSITLPQRPPPLRSTELNTTELDMFSFATSVNPPFDIQTKLFQQLHEATDNTANHGPNDGVALAHLNLSVCYRLGFGTEFSEVKALENLKKAADYGNSVASALLEPVRLASESHFEEDISYTILGTHSQDKNTHSKIADKAFVIRLQNLPPCQCSPTQPDWRQQTNENIENIMIRAGSNQSESITSPGSSPSLDNSDLSAALRVACQSGDSNCAIAIASQLTKYIDDPQLPNPLHWMVFIDKVACETLAYTLLEKPGSCRSCLDSMPNAGEGIFCVREHAMDLLGTPLHWAVRTRNKYVVDLLLRFGANINVRWAGSPRFLSNSVQEATRLRLSPLDVAVQFHLPEMIETLLDHGSEWFGKWNDVLHNAYQLIGWPCCVFARDVIHGIDRENALTESIRVLASRGHQINDKDENGFTPFMVTLTGADCDSYLIKGMMQMGARCDLVTTDDNSNAAILVARTFNMRQKHSLNMRQIAPRVKDINSCNDSGMNALHICAFSGAVNGGEVILTETRSDINFPGAKGKKALHYAAMFGMASFLELLVKYHARIDDIDEQGNTALQLAVFNHKLEAAHSLIELGAQTDFSANGSKQKGNILHTATANAGTASSSVSDLLERHSSLRFKGFLNNRDVLGWTPMHRAAYWGDVDGIMALLGNGADCTIRDNSRDGRSSGRTPMDHVNEMLKTAEEAIVGYPKVSLGLDHARISRQGLAAIEDFADDLRYIRSCLEKPIFQ